MPADERDRLADLRAALGCALAYVAAGLVALALGFRALSDDDDARVAIAQAFAAAPRPDPSASRWLPWSFWPTVSG